jgi:hypothetical protein
VKLQRSAGHFRRKERRMRISPIILLGALAWSSAASAEVVIKTNHDVKISGTPRIVVDNGAGAIDVEAGASGVVQVVAERHAESEDEARKLPVSVAVEGGVVHIQYKQAGRNHASVRFVVHAPAGCPLSLHSGGGGVRASGATGGVEIETGGGGVQVVDARGAVRVHTGGGGIEVTRLNGSAEVESGGGAVSIDGVLSGKNRVHTGGGSINVAIPADSKLAVEGSTGGGSAHNEFGLPGDGAWPLGNRSFRGKLGDGSAGTLEMHTGGGAILLGKK